MKFGINEVMEDAIQNGSFSRIIDENSKMSIGYKKLSTMFALDKDQYEQAFNQNLLKEKSETLI